MRHLRGVSKVLVAALGAALLLADSSSAVALAPGDDIQIVSSTFSGTTATAVVRNAGTTNLLVLQGTSPRGLASSARRPSLAGAVCGGGGSVPSVGGCFFPETAPWRPGTNGTFTFQLAGALRAGQSVRICATSQFGGADAFCQGADEPVETWDLIVEFHVSHGDIKARRFIRRGA